MSTASAFSSAALHVHLEDRLGILVVDDDASVRAAVRACLEHLGFDVWLAANGWEAVHIFEECRHGVLLALLDVQMPGWDGPETLRRLRAIDPTVKCCFMSGDLGKYTREHLLEQGAAQVFQKPFNVFQLAAQFRVLAADGAC